MTCAEGVAPIAFDLLSYANAWTAAPTLLTMTPTDSATLGRVLEFLAVANSAHLTQCTELARSSVVDAAWPSSIPTVSFVVSPAATVAPGIELRGHSDLVKDLTGSGVGLEALLADGS